MTQHLTIVAILLVASAFVYGCHCGSEPVEPPPAEPATVASVARTAHIGPKVSDEVQALLDAGDATAIAADMERLAAALVDQATATGTAATALEGVAEAMTGREKTLDPRDAVDLELLETSASALSGGAGELEQDITVLRQIVIDLQAESNALYGRPAP